METFSALLAICAGNSLVTGEFPTQRPVTQSFDVFFDLRLNKRLSKQSWCWWFEKPSRPLWRHCNVKCANNGVTISLRSSIDLYIEFFCHVTLVLYHTRLIAFMWCPLYNWNSINVFEIWLNNIYLYFSPSHPITMIKYRPGVQLYSTQNVRIIRWIERTLFVNEISRYFILYMLLSVKFRSDWATVNLCLDG